MSKRHKFVFLLLIFALILHATPSAYAIEPSLKFSARDEAFLEDLARRGEQVKELTVHQPMPLGGRQRVAWERIGQQTAARLRPIPVLEDRRHLQQRVLRRRR